MWRRCPTARLDASTWSTHPVDPKLHAGGEIMDRRTARDIAAVVAAGAGVLLLAALSAGWFAVEVAVAGVIRIDVDASGWGRLGTVAGLLTIAMLIAMIGPLRHEGAVALPRAMTTALLALGAFGFTVARAMSGSATVNTTATAVQAHATLWPAYLGVALGALMACAATTALVLVMRGARDPSPIFRDPSAAGA
jgi:hypothetical protein